MSSRFSHMSATSRRTLIIFFFLSAPATTEIYTLSLHDALPISRRLTVEVDDDRPAVRDLELDLLRRQRAKDRSEEHTSELQSRFDLVCRLLLEKKKKRGCTYRRDGKLDEAVTFTVTYCARASAL